LKLKRFCFHVVIFPWNFWELRRIVWKLFFISYRLFHTQHFPIQCNAGSIMARRIASVIARRFTQMHQSDARGGAQWTINFGEWWLTTGGWSRVIVCARVNLRATAFAASSELFATYLNTRSRKCDIIKRSLRALRTLGLLGRYSGYALAAGHLRDAGEYTRWASERAQVQLQVSLPTAAVDFVRMRTAKRRLLPAFLPALIAFFLQSMPIFWLAIRAQWYHAVACGFSGHPQFENITLIHNSKGKEL